MNKITAIEMKYTKSNLKKSIKSFGKQTVVVMSLFVTALSLTGCAERVDDSSNNDGQITFVPTVADHLVLTRGTDISMADRMTTYTDETDGIFYLHSSAASRGMETTRGTLLNNVATDLTALGHFGVSGYRYAPPAQSVADVNANFFYNAEVKEYAGTWKTSEPYYFPAAADRLAFYAYSPYTDSFGNTEVTALSGNGATMADRGPMVITYTVNPVLTNQADLMVARNDTEFNANKKVSLVFTHALTALRFQLGADVAPTWTIKSLTIGDVVTTAKYKMGTGWLFDSSATRSDFSLSFTSTEKPNGKVLNDDDKALMADGQYFLMIPQTFTEDNDDQCLTVLLYNPTTGKEKLLTYPLKGTTWTAGTVVTYAITTSSVNLVTANIAYPEDWGGEAFELKSAYDNGAAVGVYAVDVNTKKIVTANMKLVYDKTAGTWSTEDDDVLKYNRNYDYYVYAPYQSTLSGGRALGDSYTGSGASDFFSGVVNGWTVADDQSTAEKLLANDLHIGQAVHDAEHFTHVNVSMQHALGLAKVTLGMKDFILASVTYKPSANSVGDAYIEENVPIKIKATDQLASPSSISNFYFHEQQTFYYVTKGNQHISFKSVTDLNNRWEEAITAQMTNGTCSAHIAYPVDLPTNATYEGRFFTCIKDIDTYIVPEKGYYLLEVWGAQGASKWGGKGGYATGYALLNPGPVYVCVGEQGQDFYDTNGGNTRLGGVGGYNGGGAGGHTDATNSKESGAHGGGGGGGATHIATTNYGELKYYNDHRSDVLIVAGGGGGCCKHDATNVWYPGGTGGGIAGGDSYKPSTNNDSLCPTSLGAGSNASYPGYAFGQGQNGRRGTLNGWGSWGGGGGGGGWMGGYSSQASGYITDASGGGGCGYIQTSLFLSGSYSMSNGVREGNGYAVITNLIPVGQ